MAGTTSGQRHATDSAADVRWMRRALRLAGRGYTPPNPMVGCVLVRDGIAVGEGYHPFAGAPHAEVFALRAAGDHARGATAYVSLEPCSHWGRTPPCADALIEAGIARVVAAAQDPNPSVAGRGFERLRAAGIAVECGVLEAEARRQNEAFFHFHAAGVPLVTLKAAMTLDGKIATRTGDSRWITGEAARAWAHRLRARAGAILCGVGTVLADDPLMTARPSSRGSAPPRQPLRVVLDPHLRTPLDSRIVRTARDTPVIVFSAEDADRSRAQNLQDCGLEIVRLAPETNNRLPLKAVLAELGRRDIVSVLVEGGGETHARFLEERCADRLLWFIAPKLIGGRQAPTPVQGDGLPCMSDAIRLRERKLRRIGPDLLIEGALDYTAAAPDGSGDLSG